MYMHWGQSLNYTPRAISYRVCMYNNASIASVYHCLIYTLYITKLCRRQIVNCMQLVIIITYISFPLFTCKYVCYTFLWEESANVLTAPKNSFSWFSMMVILQSHRTLNMISMMPSQCIYFTSETYQILSPVLFFSPFEFTEFFIYLSLFFFYMLLQDSCLFVYVRDLPDSMRLTGD